MARGAGLRAASNTIRSPFGDHTGFAGSVPAAGSRRRPVPSVRTTAIRRPASNASHRSFGENAGVAYSRRHSRGRSPVVRAGDHLDASLRGATIRPQESDA